MTVIQKKVCMVGVFGTGKTSLVQRFVYSKFSDKYHETIGVKIDRQDVSVGRSTVRLLLWDIAGSTEEQKFSTSYLSGASAILFVVDGTRRETFDELFGLRELVNSTVGEVPSIVALNKKDLRDEWVLGREDIAALKGTGAEVITTSAKAGSGVKRAFKWIAAETLPRLIPPGLSRLGHESLNQDFRMIEHVDVFGLTHQGKVREENQDHFFIASLHKSMRLRATSLDEPGALVGFEDSDAYLFVVADGVGGEAGGRLASGAAVEALVENINQAVSCYHNHESDREQEILERLEQAVHEAHRSVQRKHGSGDRSPATTLTMATLIWPRVYFVHVGDSRAYYLRNGRLSQITRDQTLAEEVVDEGVMTEEQAERRGFDHVLTSAVGGGVMNPSISLLDLDFDDVLLLCSDGLTKHVTDEEIAEMLASDATAETTCGRLVQAALDDGGTDNVTVVLARMTRPRLAE